MQVARNKVVTLNFELRDVNGNLIEKSEAPIEYLHGGYEGIFPLVERALDGKAVGDECQVRLEPDDAFGDYDAELVHVEPRGKFPDTVAVGMQFQGRSEETDDTLVYTVTDIAEDKVVVDGNHPLAGHALNFDIELVSIA